MKSYLSARIAIYESGIHEIFSQNSLSAKGSTSHSLAKAQLKIIDPRFDSMESFISYKIEVQNIGVNVIARFVTVKIAEQRRCAYLRSSAIICL